MIVKVITVTFLIVSIFNFNNVNAQGVMQCYQCSQCEDVSEFSPTDCEFTGIGVAACYKSTFTAVSGNNSTSS